MPTGSRPSATGDDEAARMREALTLAAPVPAHVGAPRGLGSPAVLVAVVTVCVVLALATAVFSFAAPSPPHADPATWRLVAELVAGAVAVAMTVIGAVGASRAATSVGSGPLAGAVAEPASVLTSAQRRHLRLQVRGWAAVEPAVVALVVDHAARVLSQRWVLLLVAAGQLFCAGVLLTATALVARVAALLAVVIGVGVCVVSARAVYDAGRFLSRCSSSRPST